MTPPTIVGIDRGKNWFHLVGLDEAARPFSARN
jgi:hypothetical protein